MLGDVSPQTIRITSSVVTYPGRDHVASVRIEKTTDGRRYTKADLSAVTRAVLVFPDTDPTIAYDSAVDAVFTFGSTGVLEIDLSDYDMPASICHSYLILFDAEHPQGQVLVDNLDSRLEFDFRLISTTGTLPPPEVEFITDAPQDGDTYGRKDGVWVSLESVVSGVASVNGKSGIVVLNAADVGSDPAGTATAALAAHAAASDPHPQYATDTDLANHVADTTPHETLLGVDRVGFDLTAALTAGSGELAWNATDATLDLGLPGGSILQVGQEFLIRGRNTSGTTMTDGTVVYVSGAQGARAVFARAQANQSTADKTIGVITQDISNNADGFCTLAGLVRNFDTSGWAEGAELWLSAATAGALTATKPAPPNNAVRVGQVIRSHATQGQILVRVQIIEALRELHDVNITAPEDGDILVYDVATQTWLNEPNTGGTGEVNTASNLGAGTGLFAGKVLQDLQFKSLIAGTGVTLSSNATTVTINSSGGTGAVDSVNGETGVVVLTTADIAEDTNLYYTNARASAAAPVQSVNGQTGAVNLSGVYAPQSHVGDGGAAHANAVASGAAGFMTGADKAKLDGVASGATANANTDSLTEGSTNLYFTALRVLAVLMTGFTLVGGGTVLSTDSLLVAIGKLQSQVNDLTTALSAKLTNPMTTAGDIIVGGASGAPARLAAGSNGHVLTLSGGTPAWAAPTGGGSLYGAYASRPTAASAGNGTVYYATDIPEAYISNGTAWAVAPSGGTEVGYAQIATPYSSSSVTFSDITGLTFSAKVGERPLIIEFSGHVNNSTGNASAVIVGLYADGVLIQGEKVWWMIGTTNYATAYAVARVPAGVLTPGQTYTFKAALRTSGVGTAQVYGDATWKSFIRLITT